MDPKRKNSFVDPANRPHQQRGQTTSERRRYCVSGGIRKEEKVERSKCVESDQS